MNMDTCQCFETIPIFCSLDEDTFGGRQAIVIPISNDEYIFGGKISVHFCGSSMSYNKLTRTSSLYVTVGFPTSQLRSLPHVKLEKLHNCRLSGLGQFNSRTLCCHGSRHDGIKRSHPDEKKGPWRKMSLTLGSTRQKWFLIMEMLSPHCSSQHANFGHPNMSTVESLQNR